MNIKIKGGQVLKGEVTPSGSKNSAVAVIPATLLFDHTVTLKNIPNITDVTNLLDIMSRFGSKYSFDTQNLSLTIDNSNINFEGISLEDVGKMRGSSLLWGPMLARFHKIKFGQLPGGCTLGFRTLSPHYQAFRDLGAQVDDWGTGVKMDSSKAKSGTVWLTEMSPTATENAVMFATGLKGKTKIIGAASEPQVQDLCNFLVTAGASIKGIGSSVIEVNGNEFTKECSYSILSDHCEIATFIAMAAATKGELRIHNALPNYFKYINHIFSKFGVDIKYDKDTAIVLGGLKPKICCDEGRNYLVVKAQPWPGLPVDILPIFIPLALAASEGQVLFHNWMYDAGLFWTSELTKLGANIIMCDPHRVIVTAGPKLKGCIIEAPYIIRAVVSMVVAAMIAQGETIILNADTLYRGHPHFSENLVKLGAKIEEIA